MEREYWEQMAPDYDAEIFDVLENDRKGYVRKALKSVAGSNKKVIDIGCAIGKWLPLLSKLFGEVVAIDISETNLAIARERYQSIRQISFQRHDMSRGKSAFQDFDVALCVNAILTSSLAKRQKFFRNIHTTLKPGGTLILVVPSLESWLLTRILQQQWKIDEDLFKTASTAKAAKRYHDILQGNAEIDEVPTKHYLREELEHILTQQGFQFKSNRKIEYGWKTEFVNPPQWLGSPGPWDWMVVAEKNQ